MFVTSQLSVDEDEETVRVCAIRVDGTDANAIVSFTTSDGTGMFGVMRGIRIACYVCF